jgi:hypothetical protein
VSTVVREAGFDIRIYTRDHPPPHVHVAKAGAILKIDLATCEVIEILGRLSDRDARRAERLVEKHAAFLTAEWTKLHGQKPSDRKGS